MRIRTIIWLIIAVLILAGSTILCALRWDVWFTTPPEPAWNGDTLSTRFVTFNDSTTYTCQTTDSVTMVVLGDVHNTLTHNDYLQIAALNPQMQCYAQLGDFVEREQFYYKQLLMRELNGTPFTSLPILACPGNHEYSKGINRRLPDSWFASFPMPLNGPEDGLGTTYYVDFRNLRFIAIDTEDSQLLSDFTRLNAWVKQTISTAWQPWVVVMMHRPVFASRKGRMNPTVWMSLAYALQEADVIFSGHDHTYARRGDGLAEDGETHEPVWIGMTSTTHARTPKTRSRMDTIVAGGPFYGQLQVSRHELSLRTCTLDGTCIDSVKLVER